MKRYLIIPLMLLIVLDCSHYTVRLKNYWSSPGHTICTQYYERSYSRINRDHPVDRSYSSVVDVIDSEFRSAYPETKIIKNPYGPVLSEEEFLKFWDKPDQWKCDTLALADAMGSVTYENGFGYHLTMKILLNIYNRDEGSVQWTLLNSPIADKKSSLIQLPAGKSVPEVLEVYPAAKLLPEIKEQVRKRLSGFFRAVKQAE